MRSISKMKSVSVWLMILGVGIMASCNEDEVTPPGTTEVREVQDESMVEGSFDEVEDLAFSGIFATSDLGGRVETDERLGCAEVTKVVDEEAGTFTVTIDFGDGCTGPHGRTRAGKIIIVHDGRIWETGSSLTITLENFSINGNLIEGVRTITNQTTIDSGGIVHSISLVGGKVTWTDGTFATREVEKVRTWTRSNMSPMEDILKLEGTASGINRKGVSYTMEILEPIIFKRSCRKEKIFVPVSGVKQIVSDNGTLEIDFGDGTCDKTVTVTRNGVSREVELD